MNTEQAPSQEPRKEACSIIIKKEWINEEGKKCHLVREERSYKGAHATEEVDEEIRPGVWQEVALSKCEILRDEYEEDGKKRRDIVYKRWAKGENEMNPKEKGIVFFKATQELVNDEWVTMPDTETRINNIAKGIM